MNFHLDGIFNDNESTNAVEIAVVTVFWTVQSRGKYYIRKKTAIKQNYSVETRNKG